LIRRKVSKFDAIRSQILRLEYIKFDLRWGPATGPEYFQRSPRPTGCFKGPISKGRKGKMWRRIGMGRRWRKREREVKWRGKGGRGRKGRGGVRPPNMLA